MNRIWIVLETVGQTTKYFTSRRKAEDWALAFAASKGRTPVMAKGDLVSRVFADGVVAVVTFEYTNIKFEEVKNV